MKYLDYRENVEHGTFDFPIAHYKLDPHHPKYEMMHHWHPECEIIRVNKGKLTLTLGSKETVAKQGDIVYITDGVTHSGHPSDGCEYECLVFDARGVTSGSKVNIRQMENVLKHKRIINSIMSTSDSELKTIISSLFDAMSLMYPGYEFTVTGALMQFYGYVFKNHLYSNTESAGFKSEEQQLMLKDVINYIEQNYNEKITLADLSQKAGMSPKYFCSVFYKMTRKTPIEYINAYRIECACEKLITTDDSVTDVALLCGFNDVSYFTKTFKKHKNMTPLRYRRSDV
ncbi:MAG: helix-turn-helix domain-containing protein [Ruminococcus sp.]|nr:helix-turn-helix domain-containing protein [Ruminococcus sp.]